MSFGLMQFKQRQVIQQCEMYSCLLNKLNSHLEKNSAGRRLCFWLGSRREISSKTEMEEKQQETRDSL